MPPAARLRTATPDDASQLLRLWSLVYSDDAPARDESWLTNALSWFARCVRDESTARFPVIEAQGGVVATAIGTLELGVPNPQAPRGRTVRLANVITLPIHRRKGLGALLVHDVIDWARTIDADRVDLSATPMGQSVYAKAGFVLTTAPRMKLVL